VSAAKGSKIGYGIFASQECVIISARVGAKKTMKVAVEAVAPPRRINATVSVRFAAYVLPP
jgi:hypothetical protein